MTLPQGQQDILDEMERVGYMRVSTDWRSGHRHVTHGHGRSFDVRSWDALVRKGLVKLADEPQYSHAGIKYVLVDRSEDE